MEELALPGMRTQVSKLNKTSKGRKIKCSAGNSYHVGIFMLVRHRPWNPSLYWVDPRHSHLGQTELCVIFLDGMEDENRSWKTITKKFLFWIERANSNSLVFFFSLLQNRTWEEERFGFHFHFSICYRKRVKGELGKRRNVKREREGISRNDSF